jgi:hypothetical protein
MATRGVLSSSLAQGIILEREARRRKALRRYAEGVIAALPEERFQNQSQTQAQSQAQGEDGGDTGGGSGTGVSKKVKAKKGKAKKRGKKNKTKTKEKNKNNNQDQSQGQAKKEEPPKDNVTINIFHLPDVVHELCYHEFLSKAVKGHREDGVEESEIVLEREWVGFEN